MALLAPIRPVSVCTSGYLQQAGAAKLIRHGHCHCPRPAGRCSPRWWRSASGSTGGHVWCQLGFGGVDGGRGQAVLNNGCADCCDVGGGSREGLPADQARAIQARHRVTSTITPGGSLPGDHSRHPLPLSTTPPRFLVQGDSHRYQPWLPLRAHPVLLWGHPPRHGGVGLRVCRWAGRWHGARGNVGAAVLCACLQQQQRDPPCCMGWGCPSLRTPLALSLPSVCVHPGTLHWQRHPHPNQPLPFSRCPPPPKPTQTSAATWTTTTSSSP